ncbi:MAG: glycosyl hydrolase family 43, partial [Muribaculaceae bacterium]|nr:glycosyl hydrolase family 43 [Muribaculaceae bacterium]
MRKTFLGVMIGMALAAGGMNPYLPLWEHIPDGEPYLFEDPDNPGKQRVYIYGSHDMLRHMYCGTDLVVWSADPDSLNNWRYDGIIFKSDKDGNGNPQPADVLFAPDVAVKTLPNGTKEYYLYPNNQRGGRNGQAARSSRPDGPFEVINWDTKNADEGAGILRFAPAV